MISIIHFSHFPLCDRFLVRCDRNSENVGDRTSENVGDTCYAHATRSHF
ncbi:hypothetical protein [Limnospira platensis]|nr:hypothetical protein [Arthrospira platensis FACHB-835]